MTDPLLSQGQSSDLLASRLEVGSRVALSVGVDITHLSQAVENLPERKGLSLHRQVSLPLKQGWWFWPKQPIISWLHSLNHWSLSLVWKLRVGLCVLGCEAPATAVEMCCSQKTVTKLLPRALRQSLLSSEFPQLCFFQLLFLLYLFKKSHRGSFLF